MKNIFLTTTLIGLSVAGYTQQTKLPKPFETKSVRNYSNVIGWPKGKTPIAPKGFKVSLYANNLRNARNIYVAANGDVFAAQANTEMGGIKKIGAMIIVPPNRKIWMRVPITFFCFKTPMAMALPILNAYF